MEWDWQLVLEIVGPILAIFAIVFGIKWQQVKKLLKEASEAVVALGLVGLALSDALADNTITNEEKQTILNKVKEVVKEWADAVKAAKDLVGK